MTSIDARPAEAIARAVPGRWDGHLIIGKAGKTAWPPSLSAPPATRCPSRFPPATATPPPPATPHRHRNRHAHPAGQDPHRDQGSEMAAHTAFSLATRVAVYFAHPHSRRERCTNGNTNGLLREYFPTGTDITDDQTTPTA
jgi:IS30 family transposase